MREEAVNWLKQARANFNAANSNYRSGVYFAAAFLSQQCAEAALKALCLVKLKRAFPSHNLLELGRAVGAPDGLFAELAELNPDYTVSRYPDVANGVPEEIYTAKKADAKILAAKKILDWVEECVKK